MYRAYIWDSLYSFLAPSKTCTIRAAPISCREKLTSTTWRKDPSGAEELHRRLLDNHGYLTASGPISFFSLS